MGLFYPCAKLGHLAEPLWRLGHTPKHDLLTATYFLLSAVFQDVCRRTFVIA